MTKRVIEYAEKHLTIAPHNYAVVEILRLLKEDDKVTDRKDSITEMRQNVSSISTSIARVMRNQFESIRLLNSNLNALSARVKLLEELHEARTIQDPSTEQAEDL